MSFKVVSSVDTPREVMNIISRLADVCGDTLCAHNVRMNTKGEPEGVAIISFGTDTDEDRFLEYRTMVPLIELFNDAVLDYICNADCDEDDEEEEECCCGRCPHCGGPLTPCDDEDDEEGEFDIFASLKKQAEKEDLEDKIKITITGNPVTDLIGSKSKGDNTDAFSCLLKACLKPEEKKDDTDEALGSIQKAFTEILEQLDVIEKRLKKN